MKVHLKVMSGSSAGKTISLTRSRFVVGRADTCDLRPNSDAISREHCAITVDESAASIKDLGSRNGTYVNGQRIEGKHILKPGDKLAVGPLQFEVVIESDTADTKAAKGQDAAPSRVKATGGLGAAGRQWLDDDGETISQWLDEADTVDKERRLIDPDTRVFKFDETDRIALEGTEKEKGDKKRASGSTKKKVPEKKPPAKLPQQKGDASKDTQEAAAKMLRRLFNRG